MTARSTFDAAAASLARPAGDRHEGRAGGRWPNAPWRALAFLTLAAWGWQPALAQSTEPKARLRADAGGIAAASSSGLAQGEAPADKEPKPTADAQPEPRQVPAPRSSKRPVTKRPETLGLAKPTAGVARVLPTDLLRTVNRAIERQLVWMAHGLANSVHLQPYGLEGGDASTDDTAGLGWGPRRRLGDLSGRMTSQRVAGTGFYAHVDLAPALPSRWHEAVGRPEGGVTIELRPASAELGGLSLGSMLRWELRDGGQMALRLRGGRLSLQYGLNFSI